MKTHIHFNSGLLCLALTGALGPAWAQTAAIITLPATTSAVTPAKTLFRCVLDKKVTYRDSLPTVTAEAAQCRAMEIEPKDTNSYASPATVNYPEAAQKLKQINDRINRKLADQDRLREQYGAKLAEARQRLADALTAKEKGVTILEEEKQWSQSFPDAGKPDREGRISGRNGKVICQVSKNDQGDSVTRCPAIPITRTSYFERQDQLAAEVRAAEDAIDVLFEEMRQRDL